MRRLLNPSIKIIRNKTRNILYKVDEFFRTPDPICPISTADAILLLLFDGTRTDEEVERDFQKIFKSGKLKDLNSQVELYKHRFTINDLLVDAEFYSYEEIEKYGNRIDPLSLIVPQKEFDMQFGGLRLDYPLSLNFNVSTSCPFSCEYCYHPLNDVQPYLPLDRLKAILKQFKDVGAESVMLTGGDPMLRPDIDDIMVYLHQIDLFYALSTKSVLSDKRIDKLHSKAGLDRIQISLDSANPHVVEKLIHAGPGYFNACIHQIEYMKKLGIDVRAKSVLTSETADGLSDYFSLMNSLGVNHIQVVSYGRSGARHKDSLFASEKQLQMASIAVEEARAKYPTMLIVGGGYSVQMANNESKIEDFFGKRAICNAGRFSVTMLPNGEVTVCEQLPYDKKYIIGNLAEQDLMEWWNSDQLQSWLSPPERNCFQKDVPCYNCKEDKYQECHKKYSRCLRYCNEYFGNTEMPDVNCPMAVYDEFRMV